MTRNTQRIPAFLTQAWMAAACIGLIGSASGQAFEFREVAIGTGYRQDSDSISLCATLSDPSFFGFGKMKARNVRIWEIGIGAAGSITDHVYARGSLAYGYILGGQVGDTGVADINSDPFNAVLGELYGRCCVSCPCPDPGPCSCDCAGSEYRHTVPVSACVRGNTFDIDLAFGFEFRPCNDMVIAPVIGYQLNNQRQRWDQSIWGPLNLGFNAIRCGFDPDNLQAMTLSQGIYYVDGIADGYQPQGYVVLPATIGPTTGGEGADWGTTLTSNLGPQCVTFGNCFDGTVYRARWSGPYVGLDFGWALTDNWRVAAAYALHVSHYSGKFTTFGGFNGGQCDCDLCPQFTSICGSNPSALSVGLLGFQPSEMRFGSWGIGQEANLATDYRCGQWAIGLSLGYQYRQSKHCTPSDPCSNCTEVCNGSLSAHFVNDTSTVVVPKNVVAPIWQDAALQKARWSSWSALVTLEYMF